MVKVWTKLAPRSNRPSGRVPNSIREAIEPNPLYSPQAQSFQAPSPVTKIDPASKLGQAIANLYSNNLARGH